MRAHYSDQAIELWADEIDDSCAGSIRAVRSLVSPKAFEPLARYGPNQIAKRRRQTLIRGLFSRFANPLVLILLGAAGVSAFTGEVASFTIIGIVAGACKDPRRAQANDVGSGQNQLVLTGRESTAAAICNESRQQQEKLKHGQGLQRYFRDN